MTGNGEFIPTIHGDDWGMVYDCYSDILRGYITTTMSYIMFYYPRYDYENQTMLKSPTERYHEPTCIHKCWDTLFRDPVGAPRVKVPPAAIEIPGVECGKPPETIPGIRMGIQPSPKWEVYGIGFITSIPMAAMACDWHI